MEEAQGDAVEIWPDNMQAVNVFIASSTQWRIDSKRATGLDYTAVESTMRMMGIKRKDMGDILEDIRVMEYEALDTMRKSNK